MCTKTNVDKIPSAVLKGEVRSSYNCNNDNNSHLCHHEDHFELKLNFRHMMKKKFFTKLVRHLQKCFAP